MDSEHHMKEAMRHLEVARERATTLKAYAVSRDRNARELYSTLVRQIRDNIDEAERAIDRAGWKL